MVAGNGAGAHMCTMRREYKTTVTGRGTGCGCVDGRIRGNEVDERHRHYTHTMGP